MAAVFWNVAGLWKKDEEFWEYIREWDYVGMTETWVEEAGWKELVKRMPKEFEWRCQFAKRVKKRGRARGGIVTGVRKTIEEITVREEQEETEGIQERRLSANGRIWRMITVYSNNEMNTKRRQLMEKVDEMREETLVIGGDFNARTGDRGKRYEGVEERGERRKSKDECWNKEGEELIGLVEERGWSILNGNKSGDEEGQWTFSGGMGASVVDYVLTNEEGWEEVEEMRIGERVESDHQPMEVKMRGRVRREKRKKEEKRTREVLEWTERAVEEYKRREWAQELEGETVEEKWEALKAGIGRSMVRKTIKTRGLEAGVRKWWDSECKRRKREVKKIYKRWKSGQASREEYVMARGEMRKRCKEKEKEKWEELEEEIRNIRSETQIWKFVNRERKKRAGVCEGIETDEWRRHFMKLLEGKEARPGEAGRGVRERDEEEEPTEEEIERQIKSLKKKKAVGADGIPNEAWVYSEGPFRRELREVIRKVWRGEGMPEEWRKGIIAPIHKKGDMENVENYRGVTLCCTAYKIYAGILLERIMEEVKRKNIIPETQAGFRKDRGTMDNIYVLKHVIKKETERAGGKVFGFFLDLKAAFDRVDRKVLWQAMEKRGIRKELVERTKEIYSESKSAVKVNGRVSEWFWTEKGVRQGCPLSPTLFSILTSDIEEEMGKEQTGGVVIGRMKIWTLAYADDIALLATDERDMKGLLKRMEKYLARKKLQLNVDKSKIVTFRKGGGRTKRIEWKWEGEELEEVREFKYLGYVLTRNGDDKGHIKEVVKKANIVVKQVWGIGERRFKENFKRRKMLFECLVMGIMTYGAEIWGWKEREEVERVQVKYLKWALGLDRCTPNYLVLKETDTEKVGLKTGERALKYEEKARKSEKVLVKECIRERERWGREGEIGKEERFYRENGFSGVEVRRRVEEGTNMVMEMRERGRERQGQWIFNKVMASRYNVRYKEIMTVGMPSYLKEEGQRGSQKLQARVRCGNEEEANRYWEPEEGRRCKICGEEESKLEHLLVHGRQREERRFRVKDVVGEERNKEVLEWLRILKKKREEAEEQRRVREERAE